MLKFWWKVGERMSTKTELLRLLANLEGQLVSGEDLAKQLGVTRAAIWKAVNVLRRDGYQIEATTNRGYRLAKGTDLLTEEGVRAGLSSEFQNYSLIILDSVDSTNNYAKKLALAGGAEGGIVLANRQTAGRGRRGRSFFSPEGGGVYMSILLKPHIPLEEAVRYTITAALAVCLAVEECSAETPKIKWVNDVFVNGKKVCGILTEAISDFETGLAESVIVGIGVNVKIPSNRFPDELQGIATSLEDSQLDRNRLAASIISHFLRMDVKNEFDKIIEDYKKRLFILGKTITFMKNGQAYTALADDINTQGNLIVRFQDGTKDVLRSGEISIGSGNLV